LAEIVSARRRRQPKRLLAAGILAAASIVVAGSRAGTILDNAPRSSDSDSGYVLHKRPGGTGLEPAAVAPSMDVAASGEIPAVTEDPTVSDAAAAMLSTVEDSWIISGAVTSGATEALVLDDVTVASARAAVDENSAPPVSDDNLLVAVPVVAATGFAGGFWMLALRRRRHSNRAQRARRWLYRGHSW
jgi:hypothetical protein